MSDDTTMRILVVDDHFVVRRGLISFLNSSADLTVVAEADSGHVALKHCAKHMPDIVLLDVMLPEMDGIETCRSIRAKFPSIHVIMLSSFSNPATVRRAIDAGARGFLLKDALPQQIIDALHTVQNGGLVIDKDLASALIVNPQPPIEMKPRELTILRLISKGYTNKQIAYELDVSYATVKHDVREILAKSNTSSRTEAVAFALEEGLI